MDDRTGQQFGNYRLLRLLGEGSSAEVYLGKHLYMHSLAAIKVLHTKLLARERPIFLREARSIAGLEHPSIIRVLDSGFEQEQPYVIMSYAAGGSLRQRHPEGSRLTPQRVISYVEQVASALQYAHDHYIVHRNIKPQNMLLDRNNRVLLGDFGFALTTSASITQGPQMEAHFVTYLAPEQIMGKSQPASDQYALAVMIYEWLTGEPLFHGTFSELCGQHLYAPPPPLQEKNPAVSSAVEDVIIKALTKDPAQRFASIQEFAEALKQCMPTGSLDVEEATIEEAITIRGGMAADLTSTAPAQEVDEDMFADTDKRAVAVALKPAAVVEQEQAQSSILPQDDEGIQQHGPRIIVDTSAPSFPVQPLVWRTWKLSMLSNIASMPQWRNASRLQKRTALIVVALLILLVFGGVAYALPHIGGKKAAPTPTALPLTVAVTITPQQKAWNRSYTLSAVMSTPHSTQHQVQAHWLSVTSAPQSQTVKATGVRDVPGTGVAATGTLTFSNAATVPLVLNQGTVLTNAVPGAAGVGPVQVVLDAPLVVVAASPALPRVQGSVAAHAVQVGVVGNIAAGGFMASGTAGASPTPNWSAVNLTAFAGGVDKQSETYVKQSDIDAAARTLLQFTTPDPQQVLKPKLHANERLVGPGSCVPNQQQADHQANEKAATVTVSVSFTCIGDVYDHGRAVTLTANLLREEMTAAHYTAMKSINVTTKQQAIVDDQGKIALKMQAQVTGIYHFDDAALQTLARSIAGKSVSQAKNWLTQQEGVGKVTIALTGGTGKNLLPTRTQDITVTIAG